MYTIVAVFAALALTTPYLPTAAAAGPAVSFEPTSGNAWWVQVKVTTSASLTGVDARIGGGAWQPLKLQSWGHWAASIAAPAGSIVQFQARTTSGTATSGCYQWTARTSASCPGSSTTPTPTTTSGSATFTPKNGKEWWAQVAVTGSPTKVEAMDTGGAWVNLPKQSWGDYAASFHIEAGHKVQYRATMSGGAISTSCWYDHPATTCSSGTTTAPAPIPTAPTTSSGVIFQDSFTSTPWMTPWKVRSSWGTQNMVITSEPGGQFPTFLRLKFPAGSYGSAGGGEFKATMGMTPRESLHLKYEIRFPVGFDFVRGGKLPGLYGGTGPSGGNIPDGTNGWSTRLMWRTGGAGEVYAYLPTSTTWGSQIGLGNWKFTADGKWHTVEQEVVLNTPGKSDGIVRIWYDGVKVVDQGGQKFRTTTSLKVDGVFFSGFFGGNDATWATPKSVHADFANFVVSQNYIGR